MRYLENYGFKETEIKWIEENVCQTLKKALIEYKGTLILVCHEVEFYQDLVDEIWDMKEYSLNG